MIVNNYFYSDEKTTCAACGNEYVPVDGIKELEYFKIAPMFANIFCGRKCMDSFDKGDRRDEEGRIQINFGRKEGDRAFQARRAYELNCWEKHERFSLSGHNPLKGERMEDYGVIFEVSIEEMREKESLVEVWMKTHIKNYKP